MTLIGDTWALLQRWLIHLRRDRMSLMLGIIQPLILLTLAGKWWGDALYYSHVVAYSRELPFTATLIFDTLRSFFAFKFFDGLHMLVTACDLAVSVAIPWTPWGRLPKFEPVFQTVNSDGSLTRTLARGAGAQ